MTSATSKPVSIPLKLDQDSAFKLAVKMWGQNAVVGRNYNYQKTFHVGELGMYGVWRKRGVGHSWEEAFASVEEWPDGKHPRTHGAKKAPDAT